MSAPPWNRWTVADLSTSVPRPFDARTLERARTIVEEVRGGGEPALRRWAETLGDLSPGEPLALERAALVRALETLAPDVRALLERVAGRIRRFALAQREALAPVNLAVPGGRAEARWEPVRAAGCYAPAGRHPLPSSVLMTAVPARVAGVEQVWVASPRPGPLVQAAAALAGADGLLAVGGAQAVAALAQGLGGAPRCDVVVGPGNRWVTAAKHVVSVDTGLDMLAGPSELVVVADGEADPELVAADLLAQAEHDADARVLCLSDDGDLLDRVEAALGRQLVDLPTAATARQALAASGAVLLDDWDQAGTLLGRLAPEHLSLQGPRAEALAADRPPCGALFVGPRAAEVLGDYGAGPNHVLPTGATARFTGGLSVTSFLVQRTRLVLDRDDDDLADLARDSAALARLEGLEAHARSADRRVPVPRAAGG